MKFSAAFVAAASIYLLPFVSAQDDAAAPVEDLAEAAEISRPQFSVSSDLVKHAVRVSMRAVH